MDPLSIVTPLAGGALIGAAASLYLLTEGKVAGISGIVGGVLMRATGDRPVRLAFLLGLAIAGLAASLVAPAALGASPTPTLGVVAAGLLVGFGTRLGNGCTSGHGVCGIGRLSVRSLAATLTFIATGVLTVLSTRHFLGSP
jgi:uncharacterized membrane protein YedE/YeeE